MENNKMTIIAIVLFIIAFGIIVSYKKKNSPDQVYSFPTIDEMEPDSAISFGYKCLWFAIQTDDADKIAEILNLNNISKCNWKAGIEKAYNGAVFITPVIDGWTLACGVGLPFDNEEIKSILQTLSQEFGEAQFFCTHRVSEYHCWMKASNGQIQRVYSYAGDSGENIVIEGEPTECEKTLKLVNTFSEEAEDENCFEREDLVFPNEELVMKIAELWSINPIKLEEKNIPPNLGLVGER